MCGVYTILRLFLCRLGFHQWHEPELKNWNEVIGGVFVKCKHCDLFKFVQRKDF